MFSPWDEEENVLKLSLKIKLETNENVKWTEALHREFVSSCPAVPLSFKTLSSSSWLHIKRINNIMQYKIENVVIVMEGGTKKII